MSDSLAAGRCAVVTGATSAIGSALCRGLAQAGMTLCLLGRDTDRLARLAASLGPAAGRCLPGAVDLADEASIETLAANLARDPGAVDLLIHAAGEFDMGPHNSAPLAALDTLYRTNVRGPYQLTQALLPMLRAARGQIAFINSSAGLESKAGTGQYGATQHALRAIAETLRAEVNADGVRVLNVYLGRTASDRQARIFAREGLPYSPELLMQPADVAAMALAALRLPRTAEVTEIRMRPLLKSY